METAEMQTPTAAYATEIAQETRRTWSPPRLRVESIAAITQAGTDTGTDCSTIGCPPGADLG